MGINGFNKIIKKLYSNCLKNKWLSKYDILCVDLNYCLHIVVYDVKSQEEILDRLKLLLTYFIQQTNPKKGILLVADGSAPLAKLFVQRKRRLEMARQTIDCETSSLNFTPGTTFMSNLKTSLEEFTKKIEILYNINVYFQINKPGEGEIKIKKYVTNHIKKNKTFCIVSNDADMIVLLMNLPHIFNIFVLHKIKNSSYTLNLGVLLTEHVKLFGVSKNPGKDFNVLNYLLGNDYIPKVSYTTFEKLWKSYKLNLPNYLEGFIVNNKICKDFLINIITDMTLNTQNRFLNQFNFSEYNEDVYNNYIDGILWCMDTYDKGICNNYNYFYKYNNNIHPYGIILNLYNKKDKLLDINLKISDPLNNTLYSILLLPLSAKILVKKEYHYLMEELNELYEEEKCEKCKKFNQKIILYKKKISLCPEDDYLKLKINEINIKYNFHKKSHYQLSQNDIKKIENKFIYYSNS